MIGRTNLVDFIGKRKSKVLHCSQIIFIQYVFYFFSPSQACQMTLFEIPVAL